MKTALVSAFTVLSLCFALAGEKSIVSLRDLSDVELKSTGFEIRQPVTLHIKALGGGGDSGWLSKGGLMFAYGWIIDADTRSLVWKMGVDNTSRLRDDREFDGTIKLTPGRYEAYFTAYAFAYKGGLSNMYVNVDHRQKPLFGMELGTHKNFLSWLSNWWSDDISKEWYKRSKKWGMDLYVDDTFAPGVTSFTPPKERPKVIFKSTGLGDHELVRQGFSLSEPTTLTIYAVGEGVQNDFSDYGWIVNAGNRQRVWEMQWRNVSPAEGSKKNIKFSGDITLPKGEFILYYITDGSHSLADWNEAPPCDPLNWGITISIEDEKQKKGFKLFQYNEDENVILALTRIRNNEYRSEGFSLKEPAKIRIYAFGERSNSRRLLADYGTIMDAQTRMKVWTMDVGRTFHGGGSAKNRFVDEVIPLPKGNYVVTYTTDDSHAYNDWNADQPFDPEHYGITLMGAGERFKSSVVSKYVEQRDKNIIAQIVRVGDDADKTELFKLDRNTKIRIYAIGEGQNREMYDYGWIEDAKTGSVKWEMTYAMTFHAGGGRKNRMVNTTIMLEKGEYRLRFRSDDSHSYGDWNVDPPDDPEYWGITLFKAEGPDLPIPPVAPNPPEPPKEDSDD